MSNRRTQLRVAYSPGFERQSGFGVPLSPSSLTKVLTIREGGQSHIDPLFKTEDLNDCTTQYLMDYIILHRYAKLTLDLEVDAETLGDLYGMALGSVSGDVATMLGPTVYVLPATTLIVGFADGDDPGIVFSDAVIDSIAISGRVEQKLQIKVVFCGRGDMLDAVGFTFPDCETITPLRFDNNMEFQVNSIEYKDDTRAFDLSYSNNAPLSDFPFAIGSVDISRAFERGDKRPLSLSWTVTGRENDNLGDAAITVPPTHYPFLIRIGAALNGVVIEAADAILRPQATLQGFDGEVSLAVLNLMLTPTRVPGDSSTPLQVTTTTP